MAAILVTPIAAYAAPPTLSPTSGVPGTTVTVTAASGTPFATTANPYITLQSTNGSCATNPATANGTTIFAAGSVTETGDATATFTVPTSALLGLSSGVTKTIYACVYAGTTSGGATVIDAGTPAFTVNPTLSAAGGPAGTVVTLKQPGTPFATATPGIILTTNSTCPTNYATTVTGQTTGAATNITKVDDSTVNFTVPTTLTLSSGLARTYQTCFYAGTLATSTALTDAPQAFVLTPAIASSSMSGGPGGGSMLTFNAPAGSTPFSATPGIVFSATPCPTTYGSPGNRAATNVTKTSSSVVSGTIGAGVLATGQITNYNICFYAGTGSTDTLTGASATPYAVMLPPINLSSVIGSSNGSSPGAITASSTGNFLLGVAAPGVAFTTATTCPTLYPATSTYNAGTGVPEVVQASGANIRVLGNKQLAVVVPALPLRLGTPTPYQVCMYNGSDTSASTLVGATTYSSTTVHTLIAVGPVAGSALGGDEIVVTGTGFPTTPGSITATIGGSPLAVMPVSSTTFTAITPMHAPGTGLPLVVSTNAGTKTLPNAFSFLNTVRVNPNSAPNTRKGDVAVQGSNFAAANFGTNTGDAHIYLVRGEYNARSVVASGNKVNGPIQECATVLVIDDNNLVCTLDLTQRLDPAGTAVAHAASRSGGNATAAVGDRVLTSASGSVFTFADVGRQVSGDNIAEGTVITDVTTGAASTASISRAALGTVANVVIGAPLRSVPLVATTNASANITAPPGSFTQADIGRPITNANLTGVTIATVAAGGGAATVTGGTASGTGTLTASVWGSPVPDGAYNLTYVSNGAVDANSSDATYAQSVLSSSSVFTVAPF
ncbi:beta strand repeat-containing protein [Paractinoplanes durhamensis]|uniref:beta strand repeat-containing protein n=1 Tax=Paractinoplanes durhamensis TaxID=113563 RepID=UPI0036272848